MELNPPEVFLFVLPYSELFTLTHCSWNKQGGLLFLLKTTVGVVSDDCATVPCEQTFHFTTEWCNERRFSLKQWMKCWKRGGLFCLIGVIIWCCFQWTFESHASCKSWFVCQDGLHFVTFCSYQYTFPPEPTVKSFFVMFLRLEIHIKAV